MLARLLGIHQAHALPIHTEPLRVITPPFCDALASASSGQTFFSFSVIASPSFVGSVSLPGVLPGSFAGVRSSA